MVGVGVGDEDVGDLLPPQVEAAEGDLGGLAAIEQEQVALAAHQHRCEPAAGQRHHPAGAKYEDLDIHAGELGRSGPAAAGLGPSAAVRRASIVKLPDHRQPPGCA